MTEAASILFAAAIVYGACLCSGITLLRLLGLKLALSEERFLGFLLGAAILSLVVFGIALAHLAYQGVLLTLGIVTIAIYYVFARGRTSGIPLPSVPLKWRVLFWCGYLAYFLVYLPNVVAPEVSADGMSYHVGLVASYYRAHSYRWITTNLYANLSQGMEMLFLFAYGLAIGLGRASAAAMVHFLFLLILPFGMLSYGRRFGMPGAVVAGALLFFMTPVAGKSGTSAYNDVAVAAVLFGLFYTLQLWNEERNHRLLVVAGLLAGFAYAVKYTAFLALPFAIAYVAFHLRHEKRAALRAVLLTSACAAVLIAPWMIKDWIMVGNPVSPFFNAYFRNPYVHVSDERDYVDSMAHYNNVAYRDIPLEVTVHGFKLSGLVGPVFLLSPLGLLVSRNKRGRMLLIAAAVFGATYFANIETRFLIPALPFLSLALAMTFSWRALTVALVIAHAVLSWPSIVGRYCEPYAWRIDKLPWRAAFVRDNAASYIRANAGDGFDMAPLIDRIVPPGEVVLSLSPALPRAYVSRDVNVWFESAWGRKMGDALSVGQSDSSGPVLRRNYRFPSRAVSRIRVVRKTGADGLWSINELRFFHQQRELPRDSRWRLQSWPNPWDVQLAFDNNPVTRWRSWENFRPGMFVEADFGAPTDIDEVLVLGAPNEGKIQVDVQEWTSDGWRPIPVERTAAQTPTPPRLRRAAIEYLKSNGVRWLAVDRDNWAFKDLLMNRVQWGITDLAHTGEHVLYRLD
jgi:dolichyl-phosphate-mannose-protein mannosyltransferase